MDSEIANEILEELASTLQPIETQNAALLEFIKEKGIAKDEDLAPYLERAAAASAVRWRATRVRMARLFVSAEKKAEQAAERDKAAVPQKKQPSEKSAQGEKKQAENLATEPAEGKAENESRRHAEEQGEKPPAKDSGREARTEDKRAKTNQPQSSDKQSRKQTTDDSADSTRHSRGDAAQDKKGRDSGARDPQNNNRNAA